ncbi:MAG: NADH-quinone oxidoreductase subunit J [Ardenticatenaceae bacterium]|nr:NADH-quinone oxidoreductase subunit J [Ardenticatenaceae bacterium]MCB9445137.1 NADH-quinone oxidoreductase subunit J [Ardenticatenaceae bacterium]
MTEQVIFILISIFTLVTAWVVVTNRNLFHAALALMASFLGVAGIYVLLDAGFLAAAQLLVYIGAISILIIFAIMLTRRMMQTHETPFNSQPVLSGITAVGVFAVIAFVLYRVQGLQTQWPWLKGGASGFSDPVPVDPPIILNSVAKLGEAFVSPDAYVLPFELASILLLAALIGSILIAWPKPEDEK